MADLTVYGADWCADCRRSKRLLLEHAVAFEWVDLETNPEAVDIVLERNDGNRVIPTIVFPDGSHLAEPTDRELAEALGLETPPR